MGADVVQALEHEPGGTIRAADLGDHLGHHAEWKDRQSFELWVQCRDPPAAQCMIVGHGIIGRVQRTDGDDPSSRFPFLDRSNPWARIGSDCDSLSDLEEPSESGKLESACSPRPGCSEPRRIEPCRTARYACMTSR